MWRVIQFLLSFPLQVRSYSTSLFHKVCHAAVIQTSFQICWWCRISSTSNSTNVSKFVYCASLTIHQATCLFQSIVTSGWICRRFSAYWSAASVFACSPAARHAAVRFFHPLWSRDALFCCMRTMRLFHISHAFAIDKISSDYYDRMPHHSIWNLAFIDPNNLLPSDHAASLFTLNGRSFTFVVRLIGLIN